jgi:hypothetical protein
MLVDSYAGLRQTGFELTHQKFDGTKKFEAINSRNHGQRLMVQRENSLLG